MEAGFSISEVKTPCYVYNQNLIRNRLKVLKDVADKSGARVLLAQKAFACYALYPLIAEYLDGAVASGLFEARLGCEYLGKQNHIYSPAYDESEIDEILTLCDHISFNSARQWAKFSGLAKAAGVSAGVRINPEFSTQGGGIYDPCAPHSRLGVPLSAFNPADFEGLEGVHIHTLCEQGFAALNDTFAHFEQNCGGLLNKLKWLNLGGGHHITKDGYDVDGLIALIKRVRSDYGLEVYIEPGEAVVLNSGFLVTTVREIVSNGMNIAILDTSAACHMPDVLEMPYRPYIIGAGEAGRYAYTYRLSSVTCLAGDIIGDYSFDKPLIEGDRLVFTDMAHYTSVKNNTFNGINLPDIYSVYNGKLTLIKRFGYEDYKSRL